MLTRRDWLGSAAAAGATLLFGRAAFAATDRAPAILVYKSPTCGCCGLWVDHMVEAGFRPTIRDVANVESLKRELGIPANLFSCHTAVVEGYLLEGHVPADVALKFLAEKPTALGLAVAGMPMGSPGMEGPTRDAYDVVLFRRDGSRKVYASR